MTPLTILYPCYNNPDALALQQETWRSYPANLRTAVRLVLVDDCSEQPVWLDENFPLAHTLLRITSDIAWNQPGARNLGMSRTVTEWVFMSDIDHLLTPDMCAALLAVETSPGTVYFFGRRTRDGRELAPHPNSFLIQREIFWDLGGYDEDFCGHYGYDDILFRDLVERRYRTVTRHDIVLVACEDAGTGTLVRNARRNRALLKKKRKLLEKGSYRNGAVCRFEWQQKNCR